MQNYNDNLILSIHLTKRLKFCIENKKILSRHIVGISH